MHLQLSLPGPTVNIGLSSSMQIGPGMKREGLGMASNRKVKEEREVVSTTSFCPRQRWNEERKVQVLKGTDLFSVRSALGKDQLGWDRLWHQAVLPHTLGPLTYGLEVHWQTGQDLIRRPKLKKIICFFSLNVADMLWFLMPLGLWKMASTSEKGELCKKCVVLPTKVF